MASRNVQYPSSPYVVPEKLWFDSLGTNYPVWKAHLVYVYRPHGLLGFLDGSTLPPPETILNPNDQYCQSMMNPDYEIWRRTDQSLKQMISALLYDGCAPDTLVNDIKITSRDIWVYLEAKFQHHINQLATRNGSHAGTSTNARKDRSLRDWNEYSKLYSAAQQGDWIAAEQILGKVGKNSEHAMALRVAIDAGKNATAFVRNLLVLMSDESVAATDALGNTALSISAAVGNKEAAAVLVDKNPNLLYIHNILGLFPVHVAAKNADLDMLTDLISKTNDDHRADNENPYVGISGLALLIYTVEADFYDIALSLVKKYPYLGRLKLSRNSALKAIAQKMFIINVRKSKILERLVARKLSPVSERTKEQRLAVDLVTCLCMELKCLNLVEAEDIYCDAVLIAAEVGNYKVFKVIIEAFPNSIYCSDPASLQKVAHVAVKNRSERVFYEICRRSDQMHLHFDSRDVDGNNLLHLAAKLTSSEKLRGLQNPVEKMTHELSWFKAVEKVVPPVCKSQLNSAGKSPITIFREEHSNLRMEGEQWVTNTANAFMITATLVSAAAFAAAITVPGGNDGSTGLPLFSSRPNFSEFITDVSVSFFASVISLLTFLYISTTSYEEEDYAIYLPGMFLFGFSNLIFSIAGLMFTFCAATRLVFDKKSKLLSPLVNAAAFAISLGLFRFQLHFLLRFGLSSLPWNRFTKRK